MKKNLIFNMMLGVVCLAVALLIAGVYNGRTQAKLNKAEVKIDIVSEVNKDLESQLNKLEVAKTQTKDDISNYIQTYYKTVGPVIANAIADEVVIASEKHEVPLVAIVATMERESAFNPAAKGKAGERGLMQVMPLWKQTLELKSVYDLHKIKVGINSGAYILRHYLDKTNNNMKRALLKYQGGDPSYVKIVYANMGKFVMYRSFANITVQEQTIDEVLPAKIVSSGVFTHTIKKGDMLGEIAKWYTGSMSNWKKILEVNPHIIPDRMQIGSQITIPKGLLTTTKEFKKENE